jgi:hypothetical protein
VERWSVAEHTRADSKEILSAGCGTQRLSPDGRFWACLDTTGTLRLTDVASGETIFERKRFKKLSIYSPPEEFPARMVGDLGLALMDFSPDSRFLVVSSEDGSVVAWDLNEKSSVKLTGALKELKRSFFVNVFVFVAPGQLMLSSSWWAKHDIVTARLVAFPSGEVLSKPKIPRGRKLSRAADPGFVIIRVFAQDIRELSQDLSRGAAFDEREMVQRLNRAAAVEVATGRVTVSNLSALDVFGHFYVAERANGEVGLYEIEKGIQEAVVVPLATVAIPRK